MKRNTESTGWSTGRQAGRWLISTLTALPLVLFGALVVPANAQDTATSAANRLEAVDFQALGGQQMQFRLRTSGPAPQPLAFTIDKPARISLDLPGVSLALPSRRIDVKAGGIDSLVAGEAGGRTRVVLNLDALVPYEATVDGNSILLTVGAAAWLVGSARGMVIE
jgi:type IV pilus assembly protein PilQ